MRGTSLKILATIAVAIAGVAFLALQSSGEVEYYVHVDKVVAHPGEWLGKKTIQIHGFAHKVPLQPTIVAQTAMRRFELRTGNDTISVLHEGVVPDTFKEEAETVVKGSLSRQPDGTLLLTTVGGEQGIMAKCPSKYQGKR
jgi:cytochrome c-type biogenesis protein CcmE